MVYEQYPQHIDWENPQLVAAPRASQPNKRETKYSVTCTHCGFERWLTYTAAWNAGKNWTCKRCQQSAAGKLGYEATAAKYGEDFAQEYARQYRLQRPTSYEVKVEAALTALGLTFEREAKIDSWESGETRAFDFYVWGQREFVIEVDGAYWHNRIAATENDRVKTQIAQDNDLPLLRLSDGQVNSALQIIAQFNDELEPVDYPQPYSRMPF